MFGPAAEGPLFEALMSAVGGGGVAVPATPESFSGLSSGVAAVAVAMFTKKVPLGVAGGMLRTAVKLADCPATKDAIVQVMVPPDPNGGVEHANDGPPVCVNETNVISAGIGSVRVAFVEASGPRFDSVMSYVAFAPAGAWAVPDFETERSALSATPPSTGAMTAAERNAKIRERWNTRI